MLYDRLQIQIRCETEALKWYRKAAVEGNPERKNAKHNIDVLERKQQEQYSAKTQQPAQQRRRAESEAQEQPKNKYQCWSCKGTGRVACSDCVNGRSVDHNGRDYGRCYTCNGLGYKGCTSCKGTGYLEY